MKSYLKLSIFTIVNVKSLFMYKVFVSDKPIILTTKVKKEKLFKNYLLRSVSLPKIIRELNSTDLKEIRIIHYNENKLLKKFLKKLPNVVAGGGKVFNKKGEVLFIYRNGKWDLPKGKTEKKEPIELSAIREVEEETGVKGLNIRRPLETTYHIFKRNGKYRIKITYWFEMYTDYDGPLIPEISEGITKVSWLNKREQKEALQNSYANIRSLL